MEIIDIAQNLSKLKKKQQKRFFENLYILFSQLISSSVLRGPYRLVLDSNIIMRLESYRKGNITEGVLSTLLFFHYLRRTDLSVDIVVRPSVFYEYCRQKKLLTTKQHWDAFKELRDLIQQELSVIAFFDGIETFEGAEYYMNLIEHDVEVIKNELQNYESRDWKFDFIRPHRTGFDGVVMNDYLMEVPPFFAAQGLYQPLNLKYYNEASASRFLIEHMHKHICECKSNNQEIIDKYKNDDDFIMTKVLKLTAKGNLEGIADVDLLSDCNIQSQFKLQARGRYFPASIGLSIDSNLSKVLTRFSGIHLDSGQMGGGENWEDSSAKFEAFFHDKSRVDEGDERMKKLLAVQQEFLLEVLPILETALMES
ncbi:hypothetical protein BI375_07945 [Vibrio rotiferianus]|uniref:PIN domain-containing protein n=1 Tax=Vibrio rotiferianus TaxID=190895 RepID=A0ABX3D4P0_9VIBR|nr:hypothetical protein [Vibrio rotiferianus]OHY90170.1 hypothetical protein BI375_07945 [Vibrio rotiferianus]